MKTLGIIGGNGMLGSDLVHYLKSYYRVTSITKKNYNKLRGTSFNILVNANGNSRRFWANTHILDDFEASTKSVYQSIFDFTYKTYIYLSSSDVYERHTSPRHTSEHEAELAKKLSPYGFHKRLSEQLVVQYCPQYLILRMSMLLGSRLKKGPIFDIVNHQPLYISKSSKLQMITTKAVASVIELMLGKSIRNEIFNIGGTGIVPFSTIQQYFSLPVHFSPDAEKQVYEMNVKKLNTLIPLKSSRAYLREYLKNRRYDTIRT